MTQNQTQESKYQTYHVVVIEWDGEQPPTRWYDRMHALAGTVRGDKEMSVIERRTDKGLIVQEGCILCPSESLAKTLAVLARDEFEARHVMIGKTKLTDAFGVSRQDHEILQRVEARLGRRGRPPAKKYFALTCLEEMESYTVLSSGPYQCPSCKGLRIHARQGTNMAYYLEKPTDLSPFDLWVETRFRAGTWEPSVVKINGDVLGQEEDLIIGDPESLRYEDEEGKVRIRPYFHFVPGVFDLEIYSDKEAAIVDALRNSPIVERQEEIPMDILFIILDAILVNRVYMSETDRTRSRIEAAQVYFRRGGSPTGISLIEMPTPDLLSAAGPIDPDVVAKYALTWG